jgi:exodeoxyribonuclease VII small subunit
MQNNLPTEPQNFEAALNQLEGIVKKMETGELSLEDALKHFEEGIRLSRDCQISLKNAEQKVQLLSEKNGSIQTEPFLSELLDE